MSAHRVLSAAAIVATTSLAALGLAACADNKDAKSSITVKATDSECKVDETQAKAGTVKFTIENGGKKVTEFYVYADGDKIMGERENIGPGLEGQLIVDLPAGKYETACKPGMKGNGIRGDFTVTGKSDKAIDPDLKAAGEDYELYVKEQTGQLVTKTQEFADAVKAGDIEKGKALFPVARTYWERIEPVAEVFPELDPAIDGREKDMQAEGLPFTGFHRIEKALWVENDLSQMGPVADQLMKDIEAVVKKVDEEDLDALKIASGATALLDEIAAPEGKISGEEDIFSGTDVWDIAANLEGSKAAVDSLRDVLTARDPELLAKVDERMAIAEAAIAKHKVGEGYKSFGELTEDDKKEIVTVVNALKEQTAKIPGVIAK